MKMIQAEVPEQLYKKAQILVKEGWFRDEQDIFSEAIRRFLDAHRSDLMEKKAMVSKAMVSKLEL